MSVKGNKLRKATLELYRRNGKIHARTISGRFNTLRWLMVWLTQGIFYGLCWLNWESEGVSRQAVLFEIAHEKLYLFGLVLWPQDGLLLAIMLILSAIGLFFATTLAGRLFCGFACPQSVYTAIFTWVEAKIEGDHLERLRLDQSPLSAGKLARRLAKHVCWLLIAAWTGITFVGYFTPLRDLLPALGRLQLGPWEAFWLIFYSAFTYIQAGLTREMVCQHMCPYSRFQSVMVDEFTRTVSYDARRGEPRRSGTQATESAGDCVDCGICVQVCPAGIDIRDGMQYPCINCGLCIDACDGVMSRIGASPGLIRFASEQELAGHPTARGWLGRPRLVVYAALFGVFALLGAYTLTSRSLLLVDVLRDRGNLARTTPEGRIENAYTLRLMNLAETAQEFEVSVSGMPGLRIEGNSSIRSEAGRTHTVPFSVSAPASAGQARVQPIEFHVTARAAPAIHVNEKSTFLLD